MTRGRPTKFKPEYEHQAQTACELGATVDDLATLFSVAPSTVNLWMNEHPGFSEAIKRGRDIADRRVIESLHGRALGGMMEVEVVKMARDADGTTNPVVVKQVVYVPADTTAAIFWLKNRRPADWRDGKDHTVNGTINHKHEQVANDANAFEGSIAGLAAAGGNKPASGKLN